MKDQVLRGVFMVLFYFAFLSVGKLRDWVSLNGVSDATQMAIVAIVCFGIPTLSFMFLWRKPSSQNSNSSHG